MKNTITKTYTPAKDPVLKKIVSSIVGNVKPDKIILFGSRARGEHTESSDYDICVLKKGVKNERDFEREICDILPDVDASVDIVVQNPKKYEALKDKWFLVYHDVENEGEVIYTSKNYLSDENNDIKPTILSEKEEEYFKKDNAVFAREWLQRAESNLEIARKGKFSKKVFYEDLCFECQQAAEKALKAVLICLDKPFKKTHSIKYLIDLLKKSKQTIPEVMLEAKFLTQFATYSRYPGDQIPISAAEYKKAMKLAEQVVRWSKIIIEQRKDELF